MCFFLHMTKCVPNFMDLLEDEKLHICMLKKYTRIKVNICVVYTCISICHIKSLRL